MLGHRFRNYIKNVTLEQILAVSTIQSVKNTYLKNNKKKQNPIIKNIC